MSMGAMDSNPMDELIEFTTVMNEYVSCVQRCVEDLAGYHAIKHTLKQVSKLHDHLNKEEKEALQKVMTVNSQVGVAVHYARVAVLECKTNVEAVRQMITDEEGKMSDKLIHAIRYYIKMEKDLAPKLEKARDEIPLSIAMLNNSFLEIEILKIWCNRKIDEMKGKTKFKVVKQRVIAYGGAAGLTITVAVVNWWNPFRWVTGAVVIGGAATITGGVAAGVTEGITVPALEKEGNRGITSLNDAIKSFDKLSKKNEEMVAELDKKRIQMMNLAAAANKSHFLVEKSSESNIDDFVFKIIKDNVIKLDQLCDDYLSSPDLF